MRTRALLAAAATAATAAASLVAGPAAPAAAGTSTPTGAAQRFVVLYEPGVSDAEARAAIHRLGGTVASSSPGIGYAVVESSAADFAVQAERSPVLVGAARNRSLGQAPASRLAGLDAERLQAERDAARTTASSPSASSSAAATGGEPLADLQWNMRQIGATMKGSYAVERGSKQVTVAIIDTGVQGQHADLRRNFDREHSRNFTTDIPAVDGPCEYEGCVDPADVDDNGHGTHVASTIGSPINGVGIAGVAPNVTLVNLRAGQDSGYFFLQPTLDALVAAGDLGVDVVNMSFYVDPWLFNCGNNPADSEAEQAEQRTIRQAVQRAMNYARGRGVLPIASAGNGATDLGHPEVDLTSPDYPPGSERERRISNSCITVPVETSGVLAVTSTGPSTRKAYYSNYGVEQADVAAPGGDYYDTPDQRGDVRGLVLAAYPKHVAKAFGDIDENGVPTNEFVVRDCTSGTCSYYQYLQGTSMAGPHAAGVAALIVSKYGSTDRDAGHVPGMTLAPYLTEGLLLGSAKNHSCPTGGVYDYRRVRSDGSVVTDSHRCEGTVDRNGFYGEGIVHAGRAVGQSAVRTSPGAPSAVRAAPSRVCRRPACSAGLG